MLLEKAWAKNYKSYNQIEAGLTKECLRDLTGAPTTSIDLDGQNNDLVWKTLLLGEEKDFIMTAGTLGDGEAETKEGLYEGHAYSLLAGYELNF